MRSVRRSAGLAMVLILVVACRRHDEPDAYGNFETTDVVVSAEAGGRLLQFTPTEGERLTAGATVGLVDTTQLALEHAQGLAQRGVAGSRATEAARQIDVLETERAIAQRSYERTQRLYAQQAATAQQLDLAEREYRALGQRIEAAKAQRQTASRDIAANDVRVAQIAERLRKSRVTNPVTGTVLTTYVDAGEFVQRGQPLYKIADLDTMVLRAYVAEPELASLRLGQTVEVTVDVGGGRRRVLSGRVAWIASEAEFTPTPIQTREERADLVYAVKIHVANPGGLLKIGMPADVQFAPAGASTSTSPSAKP